MGFIMFGLNAEEYDRSYTDAELLRRIFEYFRPHLPKITIIAVIVLINSIADLALPILISLAIDSISRSDANFDVVNTAIIFTIIASFGWVFNLIRQRLSSEAISDVTLKMRTDAFSAVIERDMSFYDKFSTGRIVSRVLSDTQGFSETVRLSINLISQSLLVFLMIIYLFTVNIQMTVILLIIVPAIMLTSLKFRRTARQTMTNSRRQLATVNAHIQESISGIAIAKAFRREYMIYNEFKEINNKFYQVERKNGIVFGSIFPILKVVVGIGVSLIVWTGINFAQQGSLTPGEWFLFIQGISIIWLPLTAIASFWSQFQLGLAAGERIFALLDAPSEIQQTDDIYVETIKGEIRFVDVDFFYKEGEPVLKKFNLTVQPQQKVALVGHTGAGKSSIAKLITRSYPFQGGEILIDGHDIKSFNLTNYRSKLGVVTQTPFLFDGTVMDNIRYGRPNATDRQVVEIAHQVGRGDWIVSLHNGLQTQVGERGSNLSMGQRQLIAMARVLLQDPAILILDEATASIDPLTETLIQEGLDTLLRARTSIVIAHRLSTIQNADLIVVLNQGEIIELGTHNQLLGKEGHYAQLYNSFFRHQSIEYIEKKIQ
jgi:ATP-binding cassette, subfamily B, bacterial